MNRPAIERQIFIVGVPRSGTTLVQSLLAAHSGMTSFTESHFFDRYFLHLPVLSSPILTRNPAPRVQEFLAENGEKPGEAALWFGRMNRWAQGMRPLLPLQTRPVARQLLRVLDELAQSRGTANWIEKTPRHLHFIPFLEKVGSDASRPHFVHIVRDGMEVVASLLEASQGWERPYDLDTCIQRWNSDVALSLSRLTSPHDHFVFYEELTSRPEPILRQLLGELGLEWEPEILDSYGRTIDRLVTSAEPWKADFDRPIHRSATSGRVLNTAQRNRIRQTLHHDLYRRLSAGVVQRKGVLGGSD